ncbi:MAG: SBBP repeat-containing protein [Promethearchaeota archaeon]
MSSKVIFKKPCIILSIIIISQISLNFFTPCNFGRNVNRLICEHPVIPSIFLDWNETSYELNETRGNAIISDSENNIYIGGNIYNTSKKAYDLMILKYNNSGTLIWNKTWGGLSDDHANAIGLDSSNNIYIVGNSDSFGNNTDILLIKFNNSGELAWYTSWGGPGEDSGFGMSIDADDSLFIIGYSESYDISGDVVLLKFNSTGSLKLTTTWGGVDTDYPTAISIDSEENLYFTGYTSSFGAISSNFFLVKMNTSGNLVWNITWGEDLPEVGTGLSINNLNEIFLIGYTQNYGAMNLDIILYKLNSSGQFLWNFTYKRAGYDFGNSITLDTRENIYIAGKSDNNLLLLKLCSTGMLKWEKKWEDEDEDTALGITADEFDNIFITGFKVKSTGKSHFFLVKYLPIPDNFEAISDADKPDPDGNFTISWNESLDAENYSLYQSKYEISEFNSSVIEIVKGNTNRTYEFKDYKEDIYHFLVVAFNMYGNTSSNSLKVKVQFPPDDFLLNNNTEIPDVDGNVNLTWTPSIGAKNYSVFIGNDVIYNHISDATLFAENITQESFLIEELLNGDYYYVVVAYNEAGETMSNCIHIIVRRSPFPFNLTSDAGIPFDEDGTFELVWTHSEYALNYTVFISNYSISIFNESVIEVYNFTPPFEWPTYRHDITGLTNGTYYFVVVAFNEYGSYITECLEIKVKIPKEPNNGNTNGNEIFKYLPQIIVPVIIGILVFGMIFIYYKRKKS